MLASRIAIQMRPHQVLRTPGAQLRHHHPTYPRFHQPTNFAERKDLWWRWARYREDGTPRSILSGILNTTVVVTVTLATALNAKYADKYKKDSAILKVVAHLQRLDAEYGKIDLNDASEATLYLQRLLNPVYQYAPQQKNLDLIKSRPGEASLVGLQQFATELHIAHGSSGYKSLPEDMKPVLVVYLNFLSQWKGRQEEFVKHLWGQQGNHSVQ